MSGQRWVVRRRPKNRKRAGATFIEKVARSTQEKFDRLQLPMLRRPTGSSGEVLNPVLPSDLTSLNDTQLGRAHSEFCLMAQYAQLQLARLGVRRATTKASEKYLRAETRLGRPGTVATVNAQVEVNGRVFDAMTLSLVDENVEMLTQAMLEAFILGKEACSREMTRRFATRDSPEAQRGTWRR